MKIVTQLSHLSSLIYGLTNKQLYRNIQYINIKYNIFIKETFIEKKKGNNFNYHRLELFDKHFILSTLQAIFILLCNYVFDNIICTLYI